MSTLKFRSPDGDAATPAYTFTSDLNTGFYRIGADNVGFSLGGTKRWDFGTAGSELTGTLTLSSYLQGTTTNGYLKLRGDSGATVSLDVYDTGIVSLNTSNVDSQVNVDFPGSTRAGLQLRNTSAATTNMVTLYYNTSTLVGRISSDATSTSYITTSDERIKKNIRPTTTGLKTLRKIKVRDYEFHADPERTKQGFVAQELYKVYPDAVSCGTTEDEMWGVDLGRLTPLIVKSVQELDARLAKLEAA